MSDKSAKTTDVNINNKETEATNKNESKVEQKSDPKSESKSGQQLTEEDLKLYPERRGDPFKRNFVESMLDRQDLNKIKCEKRVYEVIQNSPLVKLMMSALKSHGCEVDIRRHISCECCSSDVTGGYDPHLNQVVICQNRIWNKGIIQGILSHEMLHMFDFCRAKFDFNNLDHIACSEIRAANLFHCSMLSSLLLGTTRPWDISKTHTNCVKTKAVASLMVTRKGLTATEAWAIVDRVFDKCYNDLEPVGRRLRANSNDMEWAYRDRFHYNYDS